jgi:hypothetical protein
MANTLLASNPPNKIFRYKLSDEIMETISQFAKIHQFDDRHKYKEAWTQWLSAEQDNVEREVARLQQLNYKGDILDKMFKAGRYYFREKVAITQQTPQSQLHEPPTPPKEKNTREYIVMDPAIIQAMDLHLRGIINNKNFKPAVAYNQFCDEQVALVRQEIRRLMTQNISGEKMSEKFKKTYKNRYFILHRSTVRTPSC